MTISITCGIWCTSFGVMICCR